MSTRRRSRNTKRGDLVPTSGGLVSREGLDSEVTVLATDQASAELGIRANLSDIIAKGQPVENGIMQSPSRRKREYLC